MGFPSHYNIATMGVRAGHRLMSMMGFGFEVEIIVVPVSAGGGGGVSKPHLLPDLQEYYIVVRITKKGKVWEQKFDAIKFNMATLENVMATFKTITTVMDSVRIEIYKYRIKIKEVFVKAFTKRRK